MGGKGGRHVDRRRSTLRAGAWLVGGAFVAALAAVISFEAVVPRPDPPAAATKGEVVVSAEVACREWGRAALGMADRLDRAFQRHADAHRAYQQGRMAFGPASKPGTVLYVWHQTLHERRVHAVHYRELRAAWRRACLGV